MAFEGLKSKLKAASFATGIGLASLVPTTDLSAQAIVNLGAEVRDSNGNLVQGNTLQEGQTYVINLNVESLQNYAGLDFNSLGSEFRAAFSNGFDTNEVLFNYRQTSPNNGTPLNLDIFENSTGVTNVYDSPITSGNTISFNYLRSANGSLPQFDTSGTKANVVSFHFTPQIGSAGGNVEFSYATATGTLYSPGLSTDLFSDSNYYQLFSGANSLNYNITAVPEPSTYALIAGALALGGVAALRKRRKLLEVKGRMYEAKGRLDENGRDVVDVKDLGSISDNK